MTDSNRPTSTSGSNTGCGCVAFLALVGVLVLAVTRCSNSVDEHVSSNSVSQSVCIQDYTTEVSGMSRSSVHTWHHATGTNAFGEVIDFQFSASTWRQMKAKGLYQKWVLSHYKAVNSDSHLLNNDNPPQFLNQKCGN